MDGGDDTQDQVGPWSRRQDDCADSQGLQSESEHCSQGPQIRGDQVWTPSYGSAHARMGGIKEWIVQQLEHDARQHKTYRRTAKVLLEQFPGRAGVTTEN